MQEDGIDTWLVCYQDGTNAVDMVSWDYRARNERTVGAYGKLEKHGDLIARDAPGKYACATRRDGERIARRQLEALNAQREVYTGEGAVRSLAPGTLFSLVDRPDHEEVRGNGTGRFLVTQVRHTMRHTGAPGDADAGT